MATSFHESPFTAALQHFLEVMDLGEVLPPDVVPGALLNMETELLQVGADAHRASLHGTPLAEAVRDFDAYPYLARLHTELEDVITLTLPKELVEWAKRFVSRGVPAAFAPMVQSLISHARDDDNPIRRALCRVLLFESMRMSCLLRSKLSPFDSYGRGLQDEDVDVLAENELEIWMDGEVSERLRLESLDGLAAASLVRLERYLNELGQELRNVSRELRDWLDSRAEFEARLFELDTSDAILIRNEFAEDLDVQPLSAELLRRRHPTVFSAVTRGALDTRLSRLRRKPHTRRRAPAFIDILRDVHDGRPTPSSEE